MYEQEQEPTPTPTIDPTDETELPTGGLNGNDKINTADAVVVLKAAGMIKTYLQLSL